MKFAVTIAISVLGLGTAQSGDDGCTECGACSTGGHTDGENFGADRDHPVQCVKAYDADVCAGTFYAPFDCPDGVNCVAENDGVHAVPCLYELKGCKVPGKRCTPDEVQPKPEPVCTECGACSQGGHNYGDNFGGDRDHPVKCVKEYNVNECAGGAFYAAFACPSGVTCTATEDQIYAVPCLSELKGCKIPGQPCDPDAALPKPEPVCTPCVACSTGGHTDGENFGDREHPITCLKEYDATICDNVYAPFACPGGVDCVADNDATYALPCLSEIRGCHIPGEACDPDRLLPAAPSPPSSKPTSQPSVGGSKKSSSKKSDDQSLAIGLGVGLAGVVVLALVVGFCWRNASAKYDRRSNPKVVEFSTTKQSKEMVAAQSEEVIITAP
mmetsp:Transcript_7003/g.22094  ORF Transcript_7003/g.22094 Transcript_7003/m.22094 type:complete len:385 (+) Transcript_7003:163-1317(+)